MQLTKVIFSIFTAALLLASASPARAAVTMVDIGDDFFSPATITVNVGDTVRWTQIGKEGEPHTTTSSGNTLWDSGPLLPGDTFEYVFNRSGSYRYHCEFHPTIMHGIVNVTGAREVRIGDDFFSPALITINVGDVVRWTQIGKEGEPHTTTSNTLIWDSGPLLPGDTFEFQFDKPGSYRYHCNFHPTIMHGIVNVTASGDIAKADDAAWLASAQDAPQATKLLGNYPNPFNPSTSIQYTLGQETHVTLKIYNTLGQEVATLVNEVQPAGYKTAIWNGRNDFGASVASGVYIYTLQAGDVFKSERMQFMK
jgi:plastocyanin